MPEAGGVTVSESVSRNDSEFVYRGLSVHLRAASSCPDEVASGAEYYLGVHDWSLETAVPLPTRRQAEIAARSAIDTVLDWQVEPDVALTVSGVPPVRLERDGPRC